MKMNPSSPCAPKFIGSLWAPYPCHTQTPHFARISGLRTASKGSQNPEQPARPGVSFPKCLPLWHNRYKGSGLPGLQRKSWEVPGRLHLCNRRCRACLWTRDPSVARPKNADTFTLSKCRDISLHFSAGLCVRIRSLFVNDL